MESDKFGRQIRDCTRINVIKRAEDVMIVSFIREWQPPRKSSLPNFDNVLNANNQTINVFSACHALPQEEHTCGDGGGGGGNQGRSSDLAIPALNK